MSSIEIVVPSDQLIQQSVSESDTTDATTNWVKMKEIRVAFTGGCRVKYAFRSTGGAGLHYANIYVNGSPAGTQQRLGAGNQAASIAIENIYGLKPGDLIQIYVSDEVGNTNIRISSFVLTGSYQTVPRFVTAGTVTLADAA